MPVFQHANEALQYDRSPNFCPLCNHAIEPRLLTGSLVGERRAQKETLQLVYQCVRRDCSSIFIGYYKKDMNLFPIRESFLFFGSAPSNPSPPFTPPEVAQISPQFVTIRGQAAAAESHALSEIAGVGYRRALEFLVKDFCINQKPAEEEGIKGAALGSVIERHVDDANVKAC